MLSKPPFVTECDVEIAVKASRTLIAILYDPKEKEKMSHGSLNKL